MKNANYIKSPLNYTGGKFSLLKDIIPKVPKNINTFVDLFAGGFNVGINVIAKKIICNDHNNILINIYKYFKEEEINDIINGINIIIEKYNLSETNRSGYLALREEYNRTKSSLELFVLTCFAFNHQIRFNNSHCFNTPFGFKRSKYNKSIESNLLCFCQALKTKNIEFSTKNFTDFSFNDLGSKDFVYLDPPYLISQATYNDGKRGFKDWSEKEEIELIAIIEYLNKHDVKFMLSNVLEHNGKENKLLTETSKKYNITNVDKSYSNCNYQRKNKNTTTKEVLITNF